MELNDTVLERDKVRLVKLTEQYYEPMRQLLKDKNLSEYFPTDLSIDDNFYNHIKRSEKKDEFAWFAIIDKISGIVIGQTGYRGFSFHHRKSEIGPTIIKSEYHGKGFNREVKFLLLKNLFEDHGFIRAQFHVDSLNIKSIRAIEKIGASYEGTFRSDMVMQNGRRRNARYYSMLEEEWETIKCSLFGDLM